MSPAPLPTKLLAIIVAPDVMLPVALTCPTVLKLAPFTLPVAFKIPPVFTFVAVTLPAADTMPDVSMLPPVTLPVTARLPRVPRVVKLEVITFELSVAPVISAAGALATTPVNCDPLPINNPPAVMFPVAEIVVFAKNVPFNVAPVPDTTSTFATLAALTLTVESSKMLILLVPLAIPEIPPILYNSVKFELVF